jgi:hypothetical protein
MSKMIAIPDELFEQVESVSGMKLDQFLINAARKEVRQIRARQMREEYERTHRRLNPRQVYETTLAGVVAFELKYKLSSDQFLRDFEAGATESPFGIEEDRDDWVAFYGWRTMAYGLRHMEKEYGFTREAQSRGDRQA